MNGSTLQTFFEAKSYAIIGATDTKGKLGWYIVENFVENFTGDLYLINPKGGEIAGQKVYPSILDVEEEIEAAVIAIPAKYVLQVTQECVEKGVKTLVIESGGFAEIGEKGKKLQNKLMNIVEGTSTRVIGPNCIGVFSPSSGIDTIFLPQKRVGRPSQGPISFFTQSGALGAAVLSAFTHEGDGRWISRFVSYGNAADVNEVDLLQYFGDDDNTEIILGHLEGFRNGEHFVEIAKNITTRKPVVILKTNRTELGAKASASHSASVASNDEVVSAILKQHGLIRVDGFEELIEIALALKTQPIPSGPNVGIVTDGGGFAVAASDAIEQNGLQAGTLDNDTLEAFKAKYPPWYISGNPLDLTGTVNADEFIYGIEQFCFDPNIDILVPIIIPSAPQFDVESFLDQLTYFITEVKPKHSESKRKPIFAVSLGGEESKIVNAKLDKLDIPVFDNSNKAMKIAKYLVDYRHYLDSMEVKQ